MVRSNLLNITAYIFLTGMFPCAAQTSGHPGIQQKENTDPCWNLSGEAYIQCVDTLTGGTPPTTNCGILCPLPCTYWFNTPLYKGYCYAPIELCNGITGNAICQCNGQGMAPISLWGTKHLMYQK